MNYEKALVQVEQFSQQSIKYLSDRGNLEKIGKVTAVSVAIYVVVNKLHDAFLGPLSSLKGPFFTRFINVPRIICGRPSGTMYKTFIRLHEEYGDIVRLGPRKVGIADKEMIKQALVTHDLPKGPVYKILQKDGKQALLTFTDAVWHKKRRRIVSPAFSVKYINYLEPLMTTVTESLIEKIDNEIEKEHDKNNYGTVDIWNLVQYLALDIIGKTAFGQAFNMIENNRHFVPAAIGEEMRSSTISVMYPILSKLFIKDADKTNPKLTKFLAGVISDRLRKKEKKCKDILQFLIDCLESEDHDDRLTSEAIMSETVLFLIAGSETTSNSIGFAIIELLSNPEKLEKLCREIDSIELEENQTVFNHGQLKHLPYLNAVINETLRIDAVVAGGLERVTDKPTVLGQLALPTGIDVFCNLYFAQTTGKYWPNPREFKPDRWIENGQDKHNASDLEAFFPFSAGSRNCIGKNFALQEMRISLASLLKHFDIAPIPQEMEDSKNRRHFITLTVEKNSFKIKVKRRS